jgi:hypothetical protein
MKLKTQLLLAIFLITLWQGKSYGQQVLDLDKTLLVKISPLSFLEPETIVIQGGVEYFFSPKISVQTELGFNGGVFGIPSGRGKTRTFPFGETKAKSNFTLKSFTWDSNYSLYRRISLDLMIPIRHQMSQLGMIPLELIFMYMEQA